MKEIGPIQMVAVAFEQPEFKGGIARELEKLRQRGDVRIVDLLAVRKDEAGDVRSIRVTDLTPDEPIDMGAVIGGLIGLGAAGEAGIEPGALAGAMVVADEYEYGMDQSAIESVTEDIPPGGAAILALIEHRWALGLKRAIREAGGTVVAQDMLSPEALVAVGRALADATAD